MTGDVHPLVAEGKLLVVPGVYDALSAKLAARAGFRSVVLTGYGVAASLLGEPDFGLLTQTEILETARRVVSAVPGVAVMVDGDTGHGGPLNVQRLVRELIGLGAFGVLLEDQRWPKRCGHMRDKEVVDADEHAAKIRAAVDARDAVSEARGAEVPFFITARTDALETEGIDEAIRRAKLYKDAGANVLFVEGPRTIEELRRIASELPPPLALNLIEGGRTPLVSLEEAAELGFFSVGFVLTGLYSAARALERAYIELITAGSSDAIRDAMMSFDEFNDVVALEQRYADDARYRV